MAAAKQQPSGRLYYVRHARHVHPAQRMRERRRKAGASKSLLSFEGVTFVAGQLVALGIIVFFFFMLAVIGLAGIGMAATCASYHLGFGTGVGKALRMICW